ncbi:hypothetical protein Scep_020815 [Stephania cephalantha]|uniref:Uncharacterized protein n=1 Tax=Stephania cephalantha TaxID=152367 RepID=A0AAP0F278_9MAGN
MICFGIWNSIQDTYIYLPRAQSNRLSLRRRRDDLALAYGIQSKVVAFVFLFSFGYRNLFLFDRDRDVPHTNIFFHIVLLI